ncbi:competence type IV pilus assembly protein ComGB [Bacillus sp. REN10]|uniref:competence type IV pilus assembly protein ComGB n=1 Tax=Bacillus sp. REN10 TaxID=2782541 RepID=UPI0023AEDD36|nr:competence type IV pilus assembly protein ComGB [Bacillus sp. REN10]
MIVGYLKKRRATKYQGEFIFRLGEMLQQGFTIGGALEFLLLNFDRNHQQSIRLIRSELNAGTPLNEILQLLQFPSTICLQVFFAEKHGHLPATLKHAGDQWKKTEEAKEKLTKLLQYPLFLLFILFMLLFLLNSFLTPRFEELYSSLGFTPQGGTFALIAFLQVAPPLFLMMTSLFLILFIMFFLYYQKQTPQKRITFLMKIPVVSAYFSLFFTRLFSKEVSYLLKSGFAVNEVLFILQQQMMHPILKHIAAEMKAALLLGHSFAEAAEKIPCFEKQLAKLLRHGEANGRLAEELFIFSEFCERVIEKRVKNMLAVLQPSIFLFVGIVVVAIYLSVMLPMFQMVGSI